MKVKVEDPVTTGEMNILFTATVQAEIARVGSGAL